MSHFGMQIAHKDRSIIVFHFASKKRQAQLTSINCWQPILNSEMDFSFCTQMKVANILAL